MKFIKTLTILVFSSFIFLYACNDKSKSTEQETIKSVDATDSPAPIKQETTKPADITNSTQQSKTEPSQNSQGVWHYTCSKGCSGGAGSAVNCNTCGNLLAHNTAYHAKANTTPTENNLATPYITTPTNTSNTKPAEPSQNLAGVWHYTCGKGCAGGAGSASACSNCGSTLAHNSAYHQ